MKKLISLLVVLAMVLSLAPALPVAFAATTTDSIVAGDGTQDSPWTLYALDSITGTMTEDTDDYYVYVAEVSGTYKMTDFSGGMVMVWLDEIVWGGQIADPGMGFSVEAGQKIYVNMFYNDVYTGPYSMNFSFMTVLGDASLDGEITTDDALLAMMYELGLIGATNLSLAAADVNGDGEVTTDDALEIMMYELGLIDQFSGYVPEPELGDKEMPDELIVNDPNGTSIFTDNDGYYYTWTAEENTLFVLEMASDNWTYCIVVNDGADYEGAVHSSTDDVVITCEVVEVFVGDVVTVFVSTATRSTDKVSFLSGTCKGTEDDPLEPGWAWNGNGSVATVNLILPETEVYIETKNGMYLTIDGINCGLQNGSIICLDGASGAHSMVYTYPEGTALNPYVLPADGGTYTVDTLLDMDSYQYRYSFVYYANSAGTLTIAIDEQFEGNWYYTISSSTDYKSSSNSAVVPTKTYNMQVAEGDIVTVFVAEKSTTYWMYYSSVTIPVSFSFTAGEQSEATETGTLIEGTNELTIGGDYEYAKNVYTYTANKTGTVYFTIRGYYANGVSNTSVLTDGCTSLRINGEFVTEDFTYSVDATAGEEIEVALYSLDGYEYYMVLEVSEDGFYTAVAGDREMPIKLFPELFPTETVIPAEGDAWYQFSVDWDHMDAYAGGNLVFVGENITAYVVSYSYSEGFVYAEYTAVDGEVIIPIDYNFLYGQYPIWVCNNGTENASTTVDIDFALGHKMNPDVLALGDNVKQLIDGASYYYTYTATEAGKLTITVSGDNDYWFYGVNSRTYYPLNGDATTASVILAAGEQVTIYIEGDGHYDYSTWEYVYPPVNVTVNLAFDNTVTSCSHDAIYQTYDPNTYDLLEVCDACGAEICRYTSVEVEWDATWTTASYTVTVPAGTTYYFAASSIGGMAMTVTSGGNTVATGTATNWPEYYYGTFSITNSGTAAAEFTATFSPPVGSYSNPAPMVLGENSITLEAGSDSYCFTWAATADGTLTIAIESTAAGWFYCVSNITAYQYGDYNYSDDDPAVNPEVIEVSAGDVIKIEVATYDPDTWGRPAGTITITASFATGE